MTELKRCPFCGGEAELRKVFDYYEVVCNECTSKTDEYYLEDEAIEAWNKRPNPWHTGVPTEEGWYLIKFVIGKKGEEEVCYRTEKYKPSLYCSFDNMKWQKIYPYKEKQDGHTD